MAISSIYTDLNDTVVPSQRFNRITESLGKINLTFVCDVANVFEQNVNALTATEQREMFALWQGNGQLLIDYIAQVNAFSAAQTPEKQIDLKYPLSLDGDGNIVVDSTILNLTLPPLLLDDVAATDTTESVGLGSCYTGTYDVEFDYELAGVPSSAKIVDIEFNNADGTSPVVVGQLVLDTVTSVVETLSFQGVVLTNQDRVNFTYRGLASGDVISVHAIRLSDI